MAYVQVLIYETETQFVPRKARRTFTHQPSFPLAQPELRGPESAHAWPESAQYQGVPRLVRTVL